MTRFLNVPLDVSDVFLMTFMILLDSYMEPTRVGSDYDMSCYNFHCHIFNDYIDFKKKKSLLHHVSNYTIHACMNIVACMEAPS